MTIKPWVEYEVAGGSVMLMIGSGYFRGIVLNGHIDIDNPQAIAAIKEMLYVAPILAASEKILGYTPSHWEWDGSTIKPEAEIILSAPFDIIPVDSEVRRLAWQVMNGGFAKPAKQPKTEPKHPGYVYLLSSSDGSFKIGRTKNPDRRINDFRSHRLVVEYICLIETQNMIRLEADLHIKFKDKRIQGEWFDLDENDIEYIKGLAL